MDTVRKFRLFWAWQDEQEEEWLREMSAEGLHLQQAIFPGFYYFIQGEPRNYVYRLDFKSSSQRDMASYVQIFEDAGWQHLGKFPNGWQYFRKEARPGETLDIYTDIDSKVEKYKRLIGFLGAFLPLLIVNVVNISHQEMPLFIELLVLSTLILYVVFFFKIWQRIKNLRGRS